MKQLDEQLVVLFVFLVLQVLFFNLHLLLLLDDEIHNLGGFFAIFLRSGVEGFKDCVGDCMFVEWSFNRLAPSSDLRNLAYQATCIVPLGNLLGNIELLNLVLLKR